ncbi:Uncharacterized protein Fot_35933 [Forsythia ovata]|uniref:Uncharacterized protein n=1 Tax=Forsythia ovata TaxID=205694 RepID=A0ABD1SMZ9_9LAMI
MTVSPESAYQFGELVADPDTNELLHYTGKPETFVSGRINCGVYIFTPDIFTAIQFQGESTQRKDTAHAEYGSCLLKREESCGSSRSDLADHGISETEGSSLLGDEEPSPEITKSCLEWCIEHSIEYIEACASNADFDKCIPATEYFDNFLSDLSEEESEYELEYEVLYSGSAEP